MTVEFYFDYYEDGAQIERTTEVLIIIMSIISALIVLLRMFFWVKLNPRQYLGRHFTMNCTVKFLYYACDTWSNVLFLVNFIITMYWYIMYKMQGNAYILLPQRRIENSAYDKFFYILIAITVTKGLAILLKIMEQSSADIFIMDWERFEYMRKVQVPVEA